MPDSIYFRTLRPEQNNQPDLQSELYLWNSPYNPLRANHPGYIGGLISQPIEQVGVHKAIEADYLPKPPRRDQRIFVKAPVPVYTQNPQPASGLKLSEPKKPTIKLKPVFETLFEEDRIW